MIPQHLSLTNEHPTPTAIVDAARETMGGIDLDPASMGEEANERIGAKRIIALPSDGLEREWHGKVFLNPPGGRTPEKWRDRFETRSSACAWWRKLVDECRAGRAEEAIFVGFNIEILRTTQGSTKWRAALDFPFCVPSSRLKFGGEQPPHANAIIYVGRRPTRFVNAFRAIGYCRLL